MDKLKVEQQTIATERLTISEEQARIRQNMEQLDRNSELYMRYVKKFAEQEDQVETLRKRSAEVADQLTDKTDALEKYVAELEVE